MSLIDKFSIEYMSFLVIQTSHKLENCSVSTTVSFNLNFLSLYFTKEKLFIGKLKSNSMSLFRIKISTDQV